MLLSLKELDQIKFAKRLTLISAAIALVIMFYQLQMKPVPTLADQGDYAYVANVVGLDFTEATKQLPRIDRYFNQPIHEYFIKGPSILFFLSPSIIVPVSIAALIDHFIFSSPNMQIQTLGLIFSLLYALAIFLFIRYAPVRDPRLRILLAALCTFILLDGNFMIWFNTLFGEGTMSLGVLFFLGCAFYAISVSEREKRTLSVVLLLVSISFLCTSKPQMFACIPFVMIFALRVLLIKRELATKVTIIIFCVVVVIQSFVPYFAYSSSVQISTQYNAVFYGVLEVATDKREALTSMGLNPDMEVDAGQNAYQDKSKYNLFGELGRTQFTPNINNGKLAKYYLTHPIELWKAMDYTSTNAFNVTTNNLAIYSDSRNTDKEAVFDRWTGWTSLMKQFNPKNIFFIIAFFTLFLGVSIFEYLRRKNKKERLFIELIWATILIGVIQFSISFLANGKADIAKHIYIFNYVYSLMVIASILYVVNLIMKKNSTPKKL